MIVKARRLVWQAGIVLLASLVMLACWPAGRAQAHANLERSYPLQGETLAQAPQALVLEYSEELDPRFSRVNLVDSNFQVVVAGPGIVEPASPQTLRLELADLPDGVYSAIWQVRSAVDGHTTNGTLSFSVGASGPRPSLLPPPGAPEPATALPAPADTLLRWLSYLAAALVSGSALFALLVWLPAFRAWQEPEAGVDHAATRLFRRLIQAGSLGLGLATLGSVIFQATQARGNTFQTPVWISIFQLLGGHTGEMTLVRLGLLVLIFLLARGLPSAGRGPARPWWEVAVLGGGVLLTFSLQSHGAALGSALPVVLDWFHLLGMSAWLGGLLPLFVLIHTAGAPLALLVRRFSRVAVVSVLALVLTGLYHAYLHVGSLEALRATTYGRTLSAKAGIFILLLALGAVNLLVLSPKLSGVRTAAARWLRVTVRAELLLGLLVLLASGLLTSVSPAIGSLQAQRRLGLLETARAGEVQLKLRVAPGQVGENDFGIDVLDRRPGAETVKGEVLLRFSRTDADIGTTQVETLTNDGSRYSTRGSYLALAGPWQVEVILRRSGYDDVHSTFEFRIGGGEEVEAGDLAGESIRPNPIPPDAASLARGQNLYESNCLSCHGPHGQGDGPVGVTLNPRPVDLSQHTAPGIHTDGQLFEWISTGYPGSVMPAFEGMLAEEERWHLVNYIRTFAPGMHHSSP